MQRLVLAVGVGFILLGCERNLSSNNPERQSSHLPSKMEHPTLLPSPITISPRKMGPVWIGMRVGELPTALPAVSIEQQDSLYGAGFCLNLVADHESLMIVYPEIANKKSRVIDPAQVILAIDTFSPRPTTEEGIHVGMSLREVELKWGPVKEIVLAENIPEEYVAFARSPKWLLIRTKGGIDFKSNGGAPVTNKFKAEAKIQSLAIGVDLSGPVENPHAPN